MAVAVENYDWSNMTIKETKNALNKVVSDAINQYPNDSEKKIESKVAEIFGSHVSISTSKSSGGVMFMAMANYSGCEYGKHGNVISI